MWPLFIKQPLFPVQNLLKSASRCASNAMLLVCLALLHPHVIGAVVSAAAINNLTIASGFAGIELLAAAAAAAARSAGEWKSF